MKLSILLTVVLCAALNDTPSAQKKAAVKPRVVLSKDSLSHVLESAYRNNSLSKLKEFFASWQQETPAVTEQELAPMNDTLRNAYEAFSAFYHPDSLERDGGSEWGNDIYSKANAFIVQNRVDIYFDTTSNWTATFNEPGLHTDSIIDFRPRIQSKIASVYLTSKYDSILNSFLQNEHTKLGDPDIMTPARAKGESERRKEFLERMVTIFYGHWGGYWQLLTYPEAYGITFDPEMQHARISFRMVYQFGVAELNKADGVWRLTSSRLTGIE